MDVGAQERGGINAASHNLDSHLSTDKQTAVSEALEILSGLPNRRALAIFNAIKILRGGNSNFSLVDIIESRKPVFGEQLVKHVTPGQETKPLDLRRKIWEQDPQRFARELVRDTARRNREAKRTQKALEQSGVDVRQILKARIPQKNKDIKLSLRDLSSLFDPISGRLVIPASYDLSGSIFASFYDDRHKIGNFQSAQGTIELRGQTFYATQETGDVEDKLQTVQEDLGKILTVVSQYAGKRGEMGNTRDYLLYLGVLDLMKHHSITLFHALTYNERKLDFPQDRDEFYKYQQAKQQAIELMRTSVRIFYQTLFGTNYDKGIDFSRIQQGLPQLVGYINQSMLAGIGTKPGDGASIDEKTSYSNKKAQLNNRFRVLEGSNSLIIALGASQVVKQHPGMDLIVGIPSGGTETAIVTQLIYQLLQKQSPQLFFLPISLHSQISNRFTIADLSAFLGAYYPGFFADKKVLIVDDNSETGHTLEIAAKALMMHRVAELAVHLVDFSARRLIDQKHPVRRSDRFYRPSLSTSTLGLTQLDAKGRYVYDAQREQDTIRAKVQFGDSG